MADAGRQTTPANRDDDEAAFAAARIDYETGKGSQLEIAARYGVSLAALKWRIKRDLWKTRYRSKQVDRPQIIKRLFRVLELQVIDLEMEMSQMSKDNRRSGQREVAILGRLASNLETLIKLDGKAEQRPLPQRERDIEQLREKLAQRIENLVRPRS